MKKRKRKLVLGIDYKETLCSRISRIKHLTQRLQNLEKARKLNNGISLCIDELKLQIELDFLTRPTI